MTVEEAERRALQAREEFRRVYNDWSYVDRRRALTNARRRMQRANAALERARQPTATHVNSR